MCRHLAYLGEPRTLAEVLTAPEHGLYRQAWEPRHQLHGTVNADGFGVGWYAEGDPVPARYRRAVPMWADRSFADVARVTRTRCLLAAVRSATEGMPPDESAAAPYTSPPGAGQAVGGCWLFSHNGRVEGWPHSLASLAAQLPASRLLAQESTVDSALLWALVLGRLESGQEPARALAGVAAEAAGLAGGRYNFLLTDGQMIAATAWGDTLFWRARAGEVLVASEPSDSSGDWQRVPDASVLTAAAGEVLIQPIDTTVPLTKEATAL
ncbi:ergothioneine biosynthesis protein EgtC [Sinomonas halotolerans]|uniref:Gamma-glutamyl-hercynylcysteine sulfoxide hydrolase n=1 Tax=Sinomonas halotolerans TaxID=1644133 RepID=A0ABU9X3Y3_9MICC